MTDYKSAFIPYLLKTGALRVGSDHGLKSGRLSPWFVNIGDFNDGETTGTLGTFYAAAILDAKSEFDILYGIPEKGNALAAATAIRMAEQGRNVPWFFTRKTTKNLLNLRV